MKFKNILLSLLLGLTVSGAVTATPEAPSQDSMVGSEPFISTETDTPESGNKICPFSDLDTIKST